MSIRVKPLASIFFISSTLLISGCQTPVELVITPKQTDTTSLNKALAALTEGQHQTAKELFTREFNTCSDELRCQQALAGMGLVQLQSSSNQPELQAATQTIDQLYRRAKQQPLKNPNLEMLILSLQLGLTKSLQLSSGQQYHLQAEQRYQQLQKEALALQQALEKLRRLSLQ
ncbi:MAG: hypothetical protein ACI9BO_000633 [Zhongshania sp.]|jgi:hypothetical protein